MKIKFIHILVLCTILFLSLTIGYLADALFDRRWYGYIVIGMGISWFLYFNSLPKVPKPFPEMHPYIRLAFLSFTMILLLSALGFLSKIAFGLDFDKQLFCGGAVALALNYKHVKPLIKKQ
jgi:hypothetical protein